MKRMICNDCFVSSAIGALLVFATTLVNLPVSQAAPLDDLDLGLKLPEKDPVEPIPPVEPKDETPPDKLEAPERPDLETPQQSNDALTAARTAFTQKKFRQCMELLIIASAQHPSLPPPRLVMADMYLHNNMRATGRALLERVAVEDSQHPELYRLFGSLALAEQRWAEAVMHFERAIEVAKPSSWTPQQRLAFVLSAKKGLAVAAEQRGDWRGAARALGELVEYSPNESALRDRWASALFRAGMTEKAYEQFKVSYLLDEKMSPAELSMGIMSINEGNREQGDVWFSKALAFHSEDALLRYQISVALMVQDRAEEAALHAAKASELGLESPDLNMVRGYAARQLNVLEAAERFFSAVLEENPEDVSAMHQLALALAESDDQAKQQQALEIARSLNKEDSDSARAQATLGWVQYRSGHIAEADALLAKAAEDPRLGAESLYYVGRFYQEQGRMDDARRIADRVAAALSRPGIMVTRPAARRWLRKISTEADS